jgi:elongation factor P
MRLGDGIHRGTENGNVQTDLARYKSAGVRVVWKHRAARGLQQYIIKREAFLNCIWDHALVLFMIQDGSDKLKVSKGQEPTPRFMQATQIRPGMVIKYNNELYSIFSMVHRTPGNLRAFVQVRMRNLRSGSMMDNRFSSTENVERAILDEQEMEYLYDDGEYYYFMNTETFEQMHLTREILGDAVDYLIPQLKVHVEFYEGKPMSVELPPSVDMTVMETEPGLKGASVSNVTKPAKMETGLVVQVPPFINEGEKIRVSTSEGAYQERA